MSLKSIIKHYCPDFYPLRRFLARVKSWKTNRYRISRTDVLAVERDDSLQEKVVNQAVKKWPEQSKSLSEKVDWLFENAPDYQVREDFDAIRRDMYFCFFAYGFQPDEYLYFELGKKKPDERREYVSDLDRIRYSCQMNDVIACDLLNNKWRTYEKFSKYFHREAVSVVQSEDYAAYEKFVRRHPVFVKKKVNLSRGQGVELVDLENLCSSTGQTTRGYFETLIADGRYILEEKLQQGQELAKINPSSVNTVRCLVFNCRDGVKVKYCFLRVGRDGSFVDNSGAGGIEVGIDIETGRLNTEGFDKLGRRYKQHPNTDVLFQDYCLPEWDNLLALCRELSSQIPSVKYVGWDIAYGVEGWTLIEGNGMAQMTGPQIVWRKGIKAELKRTMSNMDLMF